MWEYKVVNSVELSGSHRGGHAAEQAGLNRLGKEQWELISVTATGAFYLRRRASAPTQEA